MIFAPPAGLSGREMKMRTTNPVIHLELHTGDQQGAVAFYTHLFGWRPERIYAGKGSYLSMEMGNGVGGGVVECEAAEHPLWLPYVDVPDVKLTTEQARELGGDVLLEPREGPEGWRSVVSTREAGEVAFWQSKTGR
jgi:predicted enzyme related to lactoylglutathione lyase